MKVVGPMFSLDATGTIAGAVTATHWKGRNVMRQRVDPANPKSGPQTGIRAMMAFLSKQWASLTSAEKATWQDRADATAISPFNAFTSYCLKRWRNFLTPSKEDPAAETSTAPDAATVNLTAGVRQITVDITHGTNAPDWGYAIFRDTSTGFTPAFSNCIAVVPCDGSGDATHVDTPLAAGTYYYVVKGFMDDGKAGALSTEQSETVS